MAVEIRRTFKGTHPVKKSRWSYDPGAPLPCHAEVLVVVEGRKIAISMNGTAVMTPVELAELVEAITVNLLAEDQ